MVGRRSMISPYILALLLGWVIAQGSKYVAAAIKQRTLRVFDRLYISGNMPSAHSATIVSVATLVGLRDGFNGGLFGLAVAIAAIVMYDAVMVRRSVGEQGETLSKVVAFMQDNTGVTLPKIAKGHTPLEVAVGVVIGVCVGIVVFLTTK